MPEVAQENPGKVAEDVVQEAFVLALTRLESFRGHSSFFTWLYRIAFNTAISHQRRKRPVVSVQRDLPDQGSTLSDQGTMPGDRLDQQERAAILMAALERLSQEHRAILVLREMEGLCYEEIADILDLPIGTVRSRLHRARSQLRCEMQPFMQEVPQTNVEPID